MQKREGQSQDTKLVGAYVSPELHQKVVDLAARQDRSMAAVIRRALEREIKREAA